MRELIERLETAEAGTRELDAAIALALVPTEMLPDGTWRYWSSADTEVQSVNPRPVTTSFDAALALAERVLPGWAWSVSGPDALTGSLGAFACLAAPHDNGASEPWNVDRDVCSVSAATPALALCIAILRALRTTEQHSPVQQKKED